MALCTGEHDPLRVPAASLRPQRWQLANGRWLHQQPARQVQVVTPPPPPHTTPSQHTVQSLMFSQLLSPRGGGGWKGGGDVLYGSFVFANFHLFILKGAF